MSAVGRRVKREYNKHATPRMRRYAEKAQSIKEKAEPKVKRGVEDGRHELKRLIVGGRKKARRELRSFRGKHK